LSARPTKAFQIDVEARRFELEATDKGGRGSGLITLDVTRSDRYDERGARARARERERERERERGREGGREREREEELNDTYPACYIILLMFPRMIEP